MWLVSLPSVTCDLWRMSRGYRVRVTSSGVRRGEAVPEKTPASLVTATITVLTSRPSSPNPLHSCVTFPLLYHSIHSLFHLVISLLFLIPFASHVPSSTFLLDRDLWPKGRPGYCKSSSSSQLPLPTP